MKKNKSRLKYIGFTLLILFLGLTSKVSAQNHLYGPSLSYQYQKGSILKTGVYFATEVTNTNILKLDATANFTFVQRKSTVIPELAVTYYSDMYYIGAFGRAELTPYTISPKVGVSLFTLFEIDLGYGFSIADKVNYKPINGFTTSIRFNIPVNGLL